MVSRTITTQLICGIWSIIHIPTCFFAIKLFPYLGFLLPLSEQLSVISLGGLALVEALLLQCQTVASALQDNRGH